MMTDPAMDMSPAWSPDGKAIAFLRRLAPESAGLFLMPSLGGPARWVAEIGMPDFEFYRACSSLAWTPDGKWILVAGKTQPQSAAGIIAIGVDTAERRMLTAPPPPWSGDFSIGLSPNG